MLLRWIILSITIGSLGCVQEGPLPAVPPSARNILFLMGDDHSAEVLGAYGNSIVRTPQLDRLASQSIQFMRAYANSPVCTPSRQSIITGKLPHSTGVTLLQTPLGEDQLTIGEHLKGRGFATGAIGKMHFNSDLKHGFDYRIDVADHRRHLDTYPPREAPAHMTVRPPWRPFQDPAGIWLNAESRPGDLYDLDSEGTFFANRAIQFMEENRDIRFCLWVSFREPHSPFNFPIEYAGRYSPEEMPLPEVGPEDERWIPSVFRGLSSEEKRGIVASYYTSVEYLDKNIGLILAGLDRLSLSDSTLVIYVGDQGYLLGHHGRFEKHTMWEPAVRAPLLIRAPGLSPRREYSLVEFIDLVPTINDLLGVESMPESQGRSLLPLLSGQTERHRESVFSEFLPDDMLMIRTEEWKYVFSAGQHDLAMGYATGTPPRVPLHRLFNVLEDPDELTNLAVFAEYREKTAELQDLLLERLRQTHPNARQISTILDVEQQLILFSQPVENHASQ